MLIKYLAHGGEHHDDAVEATRHAIKLDPAVASVLIVAVGALIPYLIYRYKQSSSLAMVVALAEMLLVGLLTYSVLPVLSAIALVVGFTLILILVFSSL